MSPLLIFTAKSGFAASNRIEHLHSICIALLRRIFHYESFFPRNATLCRCVDTCPNIVNPFRSTINSSLSCISWQYSLPIPFCYVHIAQFIFPITSAIWNRLPFLLVCIRYLFSFSPLTALYSPQHFSFSPLFSLSPNLQTSYLIVHKVIFHHPLSPIPLLSSVDNCPPVALRFFFFTSILCIPPAYVSFPPFLMFRLPPFVSAFPFLYISFSSCLMLFVFFRIFLLVLSRVLPFSLFLVWLLSHLLDGLYLKKYYFLA